MTRVFEGKTALVTGSTSGIGQGVVEAFAARGANVVLNGMGVRNEEKRFFLVPALPHRDPCAIAKRPFAACCVKQFVTHRKGNRSALDARRICVGKRYGKERKACGIVRSAIKGVNVPCDALLLRMLIPATLFPDNRIIKETALNSLADSAFCLDIDLGHD